MFFNKNNYAIGIDVGSHFIKIVRLVYNNDKIGIDRYIIQKTPRQLLDNGIVQFPEDLGRILDTIFIEHDIKCKSASVSLPIRNETVLLKWIELPNLKEKEMEKALGSMIEDEFRIPANNLYFNWTKIKEDRYDGKEIAQVLLVGAIKEGVDNMVAVLKEAKIKPYHLEGDIFSLMRGVGQEVIDKNIAIIDIGFNQTAISSKLANCSKQNNPTKGIFTEIFLVEGDSAGGSAKAARDRTIQAILPVFGKIQNTEKCPIDKVYTNEKLSPLVTALGTGIGDEFDIKKLKYDKIIIMTDADK